MRSPIKTLLLVIPLVVCATVSRSQALADPTSCKTHPKFSFSISGNPAMELKTLEDFSRPQSSSFTITVESNNSSYKVYVAGEVTGISGSESTAIPLNGFTVSATNPNGAVIPPITLSGSYQVVAAASKGKNKVHILTLTRPAIPTFTQGPGVHNVRLHVRICQD